MKFKKLGKKQELSYYTSICLEEIRTMTEIKDYSILGCDTGLLYMLFPTLQRKALYSL